MPDPAALNDDYQSGTARHRPSAAEAKLAETRLMVVAVGLSIVLLGVKLAAFFVTGSATVYSDALEQVVNVVAGLFGLYSVWLAHRPADPDHPYGHGKIEFFAAGLEGAMILLVSLATLIKSVGVLFGHADGVTTKGLPIGIALTFGAMVANGLMGGVLIRAGNRRGSPTLRADGWHLLADVVSSGVALVALLVVRFTGWQRADPLLAIAVSFLIAWAAVGLLRGSFAGLMDQRDDDDDASVRVILDRHAAGESPATCGYHKVRVRHTGRYHWVDFHLKVPAEWNTLQGHETASRIEYEIEQHLGEGNATAHLEPCDRPDCPHCRGGEMPSGPKLA